MHSNIQIRNSFHGSIKIGKNLKDMTIEEMDNLWNEAKEIENNK